jgi:thioredoxin-like negative regulator of GroEL
MVSASFIEKALIITVLIIAVAIVYHFHHKKYHQMEQFDTSPIDVSDNKPVLMLFFSHFCAASRAFLPNMDALVNKYKDKLVILKVDVDKDLQLANKYKAASLPAVILQTPDSQIFKFFGDNNLAEIESFLYRHGI